ncbi:MAG TPA: cytochrome b N-terminal domain-containing protein [Vicinamibacterales bacterium]|nr:cytochrome b N-terminal domain-containing protein [Vicinamibacterales bacterium]
MPEHRALNLVGDLPRNVWDSVFRHPLPESDLGRAQTSFTNFFLHLHPVKVNRHTLRATYTFGLGLIATFLFLMLAFTGLLLMFYYVPSTAQAYDRMLDLRGSVAFGTFLRNMHRWAAHGMVGIVFLHMCRVFFTGAYTAPREFNWVVGIALFLLTLFASFTGYLLPWDQLAFWAITVGTSIAGYAPIVGQKMKFLLLGDYAVGQEALLRFYVLHVAALPIAITSLVVIHFWRIRKDGGLSHPDEGLVVRQAHHERAGQGPHGRTGNASLALSSSKGELQTKRYGVMGFVRGPIVKPGDRDDTVFAWPDLFIAELFVFVLTVAVLLVVSLKFGAPLEEPVNIMHPPNPAKAPWYFLGLQEMVSYSAFWGGIGIPTIEVLVLLLVPYLDRGRGGVGRWFARQRLLANTLFMAFVIVNVILIVIGTFFRGPNWTFVSPW